MLKNLATHFSHCAVVRRQRVIPFSASPYKLDAIMECLRYRSAKSDAYFSFNFSNIVQTPIHDQGEPDSSWQKLLSVEVKNILIQ